MFWFLVLIHSGFVFLLTGPGGIQSVRMAPRETRKGGVGEGVRSDPTQNDDECPPHANDLDAEQDRTRGPAATDTPRAGPNR